MATRCYIGMKQEDGNIKYIYCHNDGYLSGVGEILQFYYNEEKKVSRLIGVGNISVLGERIDEVFAYGEFAKIFNPKNTFLKNKFGIDNCFLNKFGMVNYVYLFKDKKWFVNSSSWENESDFVYLSEAIKCPNLY